MTHSYAFFLGCTIPTRNFGYELSTRKVCEALGIILEEMQGFICCGTPIKNISEKAWLCMASYNLALAEEKGLDILVLCNGCVNSLKKANFLLKKDEDLKAEVNEVLSKVGKEYNGSIEVKHLIQVLYEDIGIDEIKSKIKNKLNLRVASHTGCHLVKPSYAMKFDDPEKPTILDELIEITGAKSIEYMYKNLCCGQPIRGLNDEVSLRIAKEKLTHIKEANADCIVTICPACNMQFDLGQLEIRSKFKEEYNIPVLHYPELLGLALGIDKKELGILTTHRVKADKIL